MKKTIFTLSLLLIAATLIFTGCSSKGDFELERSKGIKVTYIDEFEKTTILPMLHPWPWQNLREKSTILSFYMEVLVLERPI